MRARLLGLEAGGKPIVVLNREDAEDPGVLALDRIELRNGSVVACIIRSRDCGDATGFPGISG